MHLLWLVLNVSTALSATPGGHVLLQSAEGSPPAVHHNAARRNATDVKDVVGAVLTPCGFYLFGGTADASFLLLLPGKELSISRGGYVVVDGVAYVSVIATANEIGINGDQNTGLELVRRYRKWETTWTVRTNRWPPIESADVREFASSQGAGSYAIWTYTVPQPFDVLGRRIVKVYYLAFDVGRGQVAVVSALVDKKAAPLEIEKVLLKTTRTLEQFRTETDLARVVGQIRQSAKRSTTCRDFAEILRTL